VDQPKNVAVLGLGAMGSRIARRLALAGMRTTTWSRSGGEPIEGVVRAESLPLAVEGADFVIAMVRDDAASDAVWRAALPGVRRGAVVVECSTVTPAHVQSLSGLAREAGALLVEAPVMGSRPQADAGQLIGLITGERASVEIATSLLSAFMGKQLAVGISEVGPAPFGRSARLKLAANAYFAAQVAAMSELIHGLSHHGLNASTTADLVGQMPITSPALAVAARAIAGGQHAPLFPLELVEKDLSYHLAASADAGARTDVSSLSLALVRRAGAMGLSSQNITALERVFGAR
jgi:3-hydroxyisobutyrate dehydrogenase